MATQRPSVNAHTLRLRTEPGLAYGVPVDQPGHVAVICPACGATVVLRGRLIIEQDAA